MAQSAPRTRHPSWQHSRATRRARSSLFRVTQRGPPLLLRVLRSSAPSRHAATAHRPAPSCSGLMLAALRRIISPASSRHSRCTIFQRSSGGMPQSTRQPAMCANSFAVLTASSLMVQRSRATASQRFVRSSPQLRALVSHSPTSPFCARGGGVTPSPRCLTKRRRLHSSAPSTRSPSTTQVERALAPRSTSCAPPITWRGSPRGSTLQSRRRCTWVMALGGALSCTTNFAMPSRSS